MGQKTKFLLVLGQKTGVFIVRTKEGNKVLLVLGQKTIVRTILFLGQKTGRED